MEGLLSTGPTQSSLHAQAVYIVETVSTHGTSPFLHVNFLCWNIQQFYCLSCLFGNVLPFFTAFHNLCSGLVAFFLFWWSPGKTISSPLGKIKLPVSPYLSLNLPDPPRAFQPFQLFRDVPLALLFLTEVGWTFIIRLFFPFFSFLQVQCKTCAGVSLGSKVYTNPLHLKFS